MKYIPSWFPGAGWKRWGEHHYRLNQAVVNMPFEYVKENLVIIYRPAFQALFTHLVALM
jgi:hypothetical protein